MAGATGVPFLPGNRIDILNNGDEFYPAMLEAIAAAEVSITIEAYIYWAGDIGREFARGAGGEGDRPACGSRSCSTRSDRRRSATRSSRRSRPAGASSRGTTRSAAYTLGRFNHRTHRKSLIIDGRVAFTGGAGIADHWRGQTREDPEHWRDMQIRIEGPAVTPLQTGFAQNWLQTTGELISGPLYYPPPSRPGRSPRRRS